MKIKKFLAPILALTSLVCIFSACNSTENSNNSTSETSTPAVTEQPKPETIDIRVMSQNLYGYDQATFDVQNTTDKAVGWVKDRAPKFKAMLDGEKIDIVGVQEMAPAWYKQIKSFEGYKFAAKASIETGADCNIIYKESRFTVLDSGRYYLTRSGKAERDWDADHIRAAAWAVFQDNESGIIFMFTSTHLDNNGKQARMEEAKMIVAHVTAKIEELKTTYSLEYVPAFIVGDMNSAPHYTPTPYTVFTEKFKDARKHSRGQSVSEEYSTSPGMWYASSSSDVRKDKHSIDQIFFSGKGTVNSFKMIHSATNLCPYGEYISDHNAVVANVTIANK